MNSWRLIIHHESEPQVNLAIDEAIFRLAERFPARPTLRLYRWRPALSLGFFQPADQQINLAYCRQKGIAVTRRITGGRAVLHGGDISYCLVVSERNPLFSPEVQGCYRTISACIAALLDHYGIKSSFHEIGETGGRSSAFCFQAPAQSELLVSGLKIYGAAQLRAQGFFLQHASLLRDFDYRLAAAIFAAELPEGEDYLRARVTSLGREIGRLPDPQEIYQLLREIFTRQFGVHLEEEDLTPEEEELAKKLIHHKYSQDSWNLERKKDHGLK